MHYSISSIAFLLLGSFGVTAEYRVSITTAERVLPAMKAVAIVKAGEPGPGAPKFKPVAETSKYKEAIVLPGEGPYDVWWQPKEGLAVKVVAGVKLKDGESRAIKVTDYLGVVSFRGDGQPRAALITIAAQDDPGPDEKGHRPIQTAKDFRIDMAAPEGFYSLWLTPDNGARPRKVNDRIKVQAGRSVVLD